MFGRGWSPAWSKTEFQICSLTRLCTLASSLKKRSFKLRRFKMCNSRSVQMTQSGSESDRPWQWWISMINLFLASYLIGRILGVFGGVFGGAIGVTNGGVSAGIKPRESKFLNEPTREPPPSKDEIFLKPHRCPTSLPSCLPPLESRPPSRELDLRQRSALAQTTLDHAGSTDSEIR